MSVRAEMEHLLGEVVDVEAVLLDEATPSLIKHCVRSVAKKYGGDTQRAFAICVASMQKGGYLEKGSMKLTAKGKAKSGEHASEPDAPQKLKGYERLLKKSKKSEKDLRAEALRMIAATQAAKKEAAMKLKKKLKKEDVDCLSCEAKETPCPDCKESGGLVYEDGCDCWKCEVCGWEGSNAPANEAKKDRLSFDSGGKQFEIRWSDKKHRYVVVVTDEDWDYDDEADAADMSAEIRSAKTIDDAAEILGVNESIDEAKKKTYAQAHSDIMAGLEKDGWKVQKRHPQTFKPLAVPYATSKDGRTRLYFKSQAVYMSHEKGYGKPQHDFKSARSLHVGDLRDGDYASFGKHLARWTGELPSGEEPKAAAAGAPASNKVFKLPPNATDAQIKALGTILKTNPGIDPSQVKFTSPGEPQHLSPDQYHQKHGQCPDGYHFDGETKRCVKAESVNPTGFDLSEMRRLAGLDETFKPGTTRQRADGTYKKQASGEWEKVMSGGSTPTSAAGAIQATFGKYGPGKLHKMSPEDKDHVVRALSTVSHETLLRDSDQNAKLIQMLKGKKGHEDHAKDLEHMNKLYTKALASKKKSESSERTELRRLAGIEKYPDRTLAGEQSRLMDQRQREAAGLSGAHADWKLGDESESRTDLWRPDRPTKR